MPLLSFFTFLPKPCLLWLLFGSWDRERQCSTFMTLGAPSEKLITGKLGFGFYFIIL